MVYHVCLRRGALVVPSYHGRVTNHRYEDIRFCYATGARWLIKDLKGGDIYTVTHAICSVQNEFPNSLHLFNFAGDLIWEMMATPLFLTFFNMHPLLITFCFWLWLYTVSTPYFPTLCPIQNTDCPHPVFRSIAPLRNWLFKP